MGVLPIGRDLVSVGGVLVARGQRPIGVGGQLIGIGLRLIEIGPRLIQVRAALIGFLQRRGVLVRLRIAISVIPSHRRHRRVTRVRQRGKPAAWIVGLKCMSAPFPLADDQAGRPAAWGMALPSPGTKAVPAVAVVVWSTRLCSKSPRRER